MRDVSGKCAINYCEVKIPPSSPDYFHEKGVAKELTATLKKYIASSKIPAMIGGKGSDIDIRAGEGNRNAEEYVEGRAAPSSQDRGVAKAELELSSLQSQHHELIGRVEDEQTLLYATQVCVVAKFPLFITATPVPVVIVLTSPSLYRSLYLIITISIFHR